MRATNRQSGTAFIENWATTHSAIRSLEQEISLDGELLFRIRLADHTNSGIIEKAGKMPGKKYWNAIRKYIKRFTKV